MVNLNPGQCELRVFGKGDADEGFREATVNSPLGVGTGTPAFFL